MSETPRKLGRYELIRRIAVGGMGEIYLARASGTAGFEKTVIIKTILPHLAEQDEFVEKFLDEGRIVVNLTHGNIVPVFDMDEIDGEYFIAMDYVPGRDLRDVLKQLRGGDALMPVDLAVYIISEVCDGLAYAHRKTDEDGEPLNIVHRDVSPSNILISTEGEVKIIDFGIARAADRRAETVTGRVQGKCCYMSPEQATGRSIDHRSDIFSAGVVLYEILTGVRPFDADTDLQSLDLVRACEFDPPSVHNDAVPEELDAIVEEAMAKDPEARYDSIDAMHVDLVQYLYSQGEALTSQGLADFLGELFPEGPERDVFREMREEEANGDDEAVGLDEALNRQLEQLDEPEETPASTGSLEGDEVGIDPVGRTATLSSPTSEAEAAPGDTDGGETGTGPAAADSAPADDVETDSERPESKPESSQLAGDAGTAPDHDSAETGPTSDRDTRTGSFREGPPAGSRRWVALAAVVGVVLGAGLLASYYWVDSHGKVRLTSQPDGARIVLDGSELVGRKTPAELEVDPGTHELMVDAPGYRPKRYTLQVDRGENYPVEAQLTAEDEATDEAKEPKTFEVTTQPPGARLWVDERPVGTAPTTVEVEPDETKSVAAKTEECNRTKRSIWYDREGSAVTIPLDCPKPERSADTSEAGGEASDTEPANGGGGGDDSTPPSGHSGGSQKVSLRFVTEPPGAEVVVDGKMLGETELRERFDRSEALEVTLRKEGYEPAEFELEPGEVDGGVVERSLEKVETGCLDFIAVHPQWNEFAVDGEWLSERKQWLKDYKLPAGRHTIRVRNPEAGKDETFTVDVEPGPNCTEKRVWDPDEDQDGGEPKGGG